MLAICLGGISLGGLAASYWTKKNENAFHHLKIIILLSGIFVAGSYGLFEKIHSWAFLDSSVLFNEFLVFCAWFMLPVSLCSGIIFTFIGVGLKKECRDETKVVGLLTLMNSSKISNLSKVCISLQRHRRLKSHSLGHSGPRRKNCL